MKGVDSLYSEFRAVDNLVARNTVRVLKAYQNARVGYHVSERLLRSFMQNGVYYMYAWAKNLLMSVVVAIEINVSNDLIGFVVLKFSCIELD